MSDYKERSNENKDYRRGKTPDPNPKGNKPKASGKKDFKLEVSYKVHPMFGRYWTEWHTSKKYYTLEECIRGFLKGTSGRLLADRGTLYRIVKDEVIIDEVEIMEMRSAINGGMSIEDYIARMK